MQSVSEALAIEKCKTRGIHCDKLGCMDIARKRVRPAILREAGMRGRVYCAEHAQQLYEMGLAKGYTWEVTEYEPPQ